MCSETLHNTLYAVYIRVLNSNLGLGVVCSALLFSLID